ncbi:ATP-dependent zinc protease [Stutzerimonas kunmingensis]|uniref:retropepsin-like aspartic peptidase RloA3 n=1 Tax=Stutzerimonas stutzeri subgroup TaxID=578833 RepID=UPI001D1868C0|nr:ATP-dependent zinc protease [Stutzerimonas chloritidismutans]UEG62760.1 ATP-dependent zinc protease [Stutzerimonas chloritidismutans]
MKSSRLLAIPAAVLLSLHTLPSLAADGTPLGWVERGKVLPEEVTVKFKLDTGALTSSMHAEDIEYFERDGDEWVRFDLDLEDIERDKLVKSRIERKLHRELTVRGAGGKEDRPVVLMKVCIGDRLLEEQFSLRDRDEMHYPVLLGRRTLEKLGPVDSARTFTIEPSCEQMATR